MLQSPSLSSVETRESWVVATVVLVVMSVAFGAPWITVVALKKIAAEVNGERSIPALAGALVWVGAGLGGIIMGRVAERVGMRWTVIGGAVMIAAGLLVSTLGPSLALYIGHGFFIGMLGIGGINAPSYVYVSRWFDRRRGTALALISSGSFLAGAIWPSMFERAIAYAGWRDTMLFYAAIEFVLIVPAAGIVLRDPPDTPHHGTVTRTARTQDRLGLAAQSGFHIAAVRDFHLLRADVDAAGAPGRLLHRSRHQPGTRRGDAVGAARLGVFQPADVGLDRRPHRRPLHHAGGIGLPDRWA